MCVCVWLIKICSTTSKIHIIPFYPFNHQFLSVKDRPAYKL